MHPDQLFLFEPVHTSLVTYGWAGAVAEFLVTTEVEWLETVSANYQHLYQQKATGTQQQAWQDCFRILKSQLTQLVETQANGSNWALVFEYELPREGGRRPDLVVLGAGHIVVFEFKQKSAPSAADIDQVAAYARDLAEYHSASSRNPLLAVMVPTRCTDVNEQQGAVQVLNPNEIAPYLNDLSKSLGKFPDLELKEWLSGDYAPLPTIVQAARRIFQQELLPNIKRAHSARIPEVVTFLDDLVETAQQRRERHLVLITGVPGAGKTLVGLQFVYQNHLQEAETKQAVFLSGNGPLITVLQYALKSRVFVQAVRNFYIEHEVRRQKAPREHIIVFDEAQRAWDAERMIEKYGIDSAAAGAVLKIAERAPDWCVLLGLIGEGQEIHVGEEEGTEQWNQGLKKAMSDWHVHCSPEQADYFTAIAPTHLHTNELFNLTASLRTHLAKDVQTWVAHLLAGRLDEAAKIMPSLAATGFNTYLTRDLETAKTYCRDRYQNQPDKRYGLLASSRARNLSKHGINNEYMATQRVKVGPWYIDPPDSLLSCCALDSVVTEFGCQGLELDFPIIGWGDDLVWRENTWFSSTRQKNVRDPLRLRLNSYRVLMTRGRDGFVVFVPLEAKMDSTYETLRAAGLEQLV